MGAAKKVEKDNNSSNGPSDNDNLPAPYEVGYGKPPAEHRFEKGKSGNPRGRPRGSKNVVPPGQGLDFGTQPANRMLLEEAYRPITVREGEKTIELPVIKAVFRALGVSAMKGNRLAQATMAELVRGIEEEDRRLRVEHYATAVDYKTGWEQEIEYARKHGLPEPTPLPHPDDVIIDVRTAEVRYEGPMTPEEKLKWDRMLECRDELQNEVSMLADAYREAAGEKKPSPDRLTFLADQWKRYAALYDRLNEPLPERYQKRLKDRFHAGVLARQEESERE